jgi:hypothetical protein
MYLVIVIVIEGQAQTLPSPLSLILGLFVSPMGRLLSPPNLLTHVRSKLLKLKVLVHSGRLRQSISALYRVWRPRAIFLLRSR